MTPTKSYLKVAYDLRPAKQVERRMLIDAFQRLAAAGFSIADYQYTGFGSIYFVDFILFHKLLGITRLLSVEYDRDVERRVKFNQPFREIEIKIAPIGDVIPTLSQALRHILWLDYDDLMRHEQLDDILQAAIALSPGSLLLVTMDVEPPAGQGAKEWKVHFEDEADSYLGNKRSVKEFTESNLPRVTADIIGRVIKKGLTGRDIDFQPLFNFLYRDGHKMLTVGGMFVTRTERRILQSSSLLETPYFRSDLAETPYNIRVPRLTRKERLYLDGCMPCPPNWRPKQFELSADDIAAYREVYRFLPAYAELLL